LRAALYLGCTIPTEQYAYEVSVREALPRLGVELVDLEGANCCGEPIRGVNPLGWVYLCARNLALAEGMGLDVLALCNGCHLSLCEVKHYLGSRPDLVERVNELLKGEDLEYTGKAGVLHTLEVLHDQVGVDRIREQVTRPLKGLKLAAYYGCHILRPSKLGRPDDSENPHKLEELIEALGARSGDYPDRLECCGAALLVSSNKTALTMTGLRLRSIQGQGFDGVATVCPYCHKMLDTKQALSRSLLKDKELSLPVFYYTQLLGLAIGADRERLGLELNLSPVDKVLSRV